jgi:HNH endonuclease
MPQSTDRFYQLSMHNRPVQHGDLGGLVKIEGVVIGGGGSQIVLFLPGYGDGMTKPEIDTFLCVEMSIEDWSDWLQRSDNPEVLVGPVPNGSNATLPKIFHRKLRYEISGAVQQKVWAADKFRCMYCLGDMGKVMMTIDHFVPLELGGKNDVTNYLSACKRCNKAKGSRDPQEFLGVEKFNMLQQYLADRKVE